MAARRIDLPPGYEMITLLPGEGVLEEAVQRAMQGCDEGTLIWSPPTAASGGSSVWPGEVDCALILRPEDPLEVAIQLVYVAGLSIAEAMTEQVPPMTRVRVRWPNTVWLNDCEAAVVNPRWGSGENARVAWMVLGVRADMAADRRGYEMPDNNDDRNYAVAELLERFCRHFLADVGRWADEGFQSLRRAWLRRAEGAGEPLTISTGATALSGNFETLDEHGNLVLGTTDGVNRRISLVDVLS